MVRDLKRICRPFAFETEHWFVWRPQLVLRDRHLMMVFTAEPVFGGSVVDALTVPLANATRTVTAVDCLVQVTLFQIWV